MNEIIEKRTINSKTYDMGDKYLETEIFFSPVHYMGEEGRFEEIETKIQSFDQWEFEYGVIKNNFKVYFGDKTSSCKHLVGIEFQNNDTSVWTNFKLIGSKPTHYEYKNNNFKFIGCFEGIDLEYIIDNDKLKENIVLNHPTSIREFQFSLKNGDAYWDVDEYGNYGIYHKKSKNLVWSLEKPFMQDAEGNISYGVNIFLNNGNLVTFVEDEVFLKEAIYPVKIDPTTTLTSPEISIESIYTSPNDGQIFLNTPTFRVGNQYGDGSGRQVSTAIKFYYDDKNIKNIVQAKLRLFTVSTNLNRSFPIRFYPLTNNFNGNQINYSFDSSILDEGRVSPNSFSEIDITKVLSYQSKNSQNYGMRVTSSGAGSDAASIASAFNANEEWKPRLIISYLKTPTLGFHDGTDLPSMYYTDNQNEIYKYLDFGTMVAGTISIPQQVYVRNLSDFSIKDINVSISQENIAPDVSLEISETRNPFVPVNKISLSEIMAPNEDFTFFARIKTGDNAESGGEARINANASPL